VKAKQAPRVKHVIMCEDIREEKNNKTILIGVYASKIIFHCPLPAVFPKLCFRICFDISKAYADKFNLKIRKPDKTEMGPFTASMENVEEDADEHFLNISLSPFLFEKEGTYEVIVEHAGKEEKVFRFHVTVAAGVAANTADDTAVSG
jgi:hypothetical protein